MMRTAVLRRPPWRTGARGAEPSLRGPRREQLFRETRRLWRLGRLLAHVIVGAVIAHGVLGILTRIGADRDQRRHHSLVRWWNRDLLRILNVRLRLDGQIATGAVLYTANHISWLDIPCLRAVVDATFVAKDEMRRWPVIGPMSEQAGTIFHKRGAHNASHETAEHMTWSLARRRSVIVFPEGTTSDGRTVRYFHGRLYQAAVRTHTRVQAVAVSYPHADGVHPAAPFVDDDNLARHLWTLLAEDRLSVRIAFCPPLPAAGQQRRTLANRTHAQVCQALGLKKLVEARVAVDVFRN